MYLRILLAFVFAFGSVSIAAGQNLPLEAEPQRGYLIGPGDEIAGRVLGEPQFDFVSTVDENGKIVGFYNSKVTPMSNEMLTAIHK